MSGWVLEEFFSWSWTCRATKGEAHRRYKRPCLGLAVALPLLSGAVTHHRDSVRHSGLSQEQS